MKVYQVGPDCPYDLPDQDERYEWLVYYYEDWGYDGSGEAVALTKDGYLQHYDLGHCSCYGPFDAWGNSSGQTTVEEYFRESDNIHDPDYKDEVKIKVAELLGLYQGWQQNR